MYFFDGPSVYGAAGCREPAEPNRPHASVDERRSGHDVGASRVNKFGNAEVAPDIAVADPAPTHRFVESDGEICSPIIIAFAPLLFDHADRPTVP